MKKALAAAVILLALAPAASTAASAGSPSASPARSGVAQQMKGMLSVMNASDLAYIPDYVPLHYSIQANQASSSRTTISFANPKTPNNILAFAVEPAKSKLSACSKGSNGSVKVQGKTIYWETSLRTAWRCVRGPSGRVVAFFATSKTLSEAELMRVIASVIRIP